MSRHERGLSRRGPLPARDAGFVTAEAAVVAPTLVLFTAVLLWGLMAACAQIQCVDAARAGARAAARGEPPGSTLAVTRDAAPRGARVALTRRADLVRVRVEVAAPGASVAALTLRGEATALAEETVGG
ncbi:TadE family type IV pilus minor pilin [Streptomyces sp. NPDC003077]|uniref:TadE family type IV pilus minor pilin n=1 Tax=Streptomyces sp. NPDC003077 TaxID=3154443 RepID=UPI0033BDA0C7